MPRVDLNADLGEGIGNDDAIMPFITSANIACGYHAGDADIMRSTVRAAAAQGVSIGAHPGYADRANFGRTPHSLTEEEVGALVTEQLRTLAAIVVDEGQHLHHVKVHGALYNSAATDASLARAIARAVADFDPDLYLVGLSGSALIAAGRDLGLGVAQEAFADRSYEPGGTLTPRDGPGATLADPAAVVAQALGFALEGKVRATSGDGIEVEVDTICLHGDHSDAPALARAIRLALDEAGVEVMAPSW